MYFIKAFGFLFLFLLANPAVAFPISEKIESNIESGISAEITGDIQELSQSTLTVPAVFPSERIFPCTIFSFYFSSTYRAVLANRYIAFSRSIDPGLDVFKIIFPFHFFL